MTLKNHVKEMISTPNEARELSAAIEPRANNDLTCHAKAPGKTVEFSSAEKRPARSTNKMLARRKSLKSDSPDMRSINEPNQTKV